MRCEFVLAVAMFFSAACCPAQAISADADPLTKPLGGDMEKSWNQPQDPTRIYGNTYYVGVAGLSSILIHSDRGLILLDGGLPQSAPLIEANIAKLGFRIRDVRYILNSHTHFDHAGGIAALARDSGAQVIASQASAAALRAGHATADDPQAAYADSSRANPAVFPAVKRVREIRDGESVRLGKLTVTAHFTPGHTPGSTTWTWRDCEERCIDVVYADSLNAISAPGFHFLADTQHGDLTAKFRASIHLVGALPCDILLSPHPDLVDILEKIKQMHAGAASNPFIDSQACHVYAQAAEAKLDARIAEENAQHSP